MIQPTALGNRGGGFMETLVKVRMLEYRAGGCPGEVLSFTEDFAADLVRCGGAEYVTDDPKSKPFPERKGRKDKMLRTVGGTT